jgi:hypothetical protein
MWLADDRADAIKMDFDVTDDVVLARNGLDHPNETGRLYRDC